MIGFRLWRARGWRHFADLGDWLDEGVKRGFCSKVACQTHEGAPLSEEQLTAFEDGADPCVYVVRIKERGESAT